MSPFPFIPDFQSAELLRRFALQLSQHELVEVVENRAGGPVPIERVHRYLGRVPAGLLAIYAHLDGFTFEWRFKGDLRPFEQGNGGRFSLPTLARNSATFADTFALEVELVPFVVDFGPWERRSSVSAIVGEAGDLLLYDGDYLQELGWDVPHYIAEALAHCFTADWLARWWQRGSFDAPTFGAVARQKLGIGALEW